MQHEWKLLLPILVAAVGLAACGRAGGPTEDELTAHVESQIADRWDVEEMRFEVFAEDGGDSGRVSCAGKLKLNSDLYRADYETIDADVKRLGGDRWSKYRQAAGTAHAVKVQHQAGTITPFTAEVYFRRVVDGWEIDGSPEFDDLDGFDASHFTPDTIVTGSPEYEAYLTRVTEERSRDEGMKLQLMKDIEQFFGTERSVAFFTNPKGGQPQQTFVLKTTGTVQWDSSSPQTALNFTVPGEARWIADGRWTHVEFGAGDVIPVTVTGELIAPGRYGYKEVTGKWTAALGMQMGAANRRSSGSLILWVGGYFKDWPPYQNSPEDAFTVMAKNL